MKETIAKYISNRTGAEMSLCFIPFLTDIGSDSFPHTLTQSFMSSWKDQGIVMNFSGHPSFLKISHNTILFKVSKAFSDSIKIWYKFHPVRGVQICWLYPLQRGKTLLKRCVLGMTLNYNCWWSFSSEFLGSLECPFPAITLRSTLTWSGNTC